MQVCAIMEARAGEFLCPFEKHGSHSGVFQAIESGLLQRKGNGSDGAKTSLDRDGPIQRQKLGQNPGFKLQHSVQ